MSFKAAWIGGSGGGDGGGAGGTDLYVAESYYVRSKASCEAPQSLSHELVERYR